MNNGLIYTHGFLVDDIDAAVRFYESNFGYTVQRQTPTFAAMETASPTKLFFWQYSHMCEHIGTAEMAKVKHRVMLAMLYDAREDVDARFAELVEDGMLVVASPQDWTWSAYAGYLVDPSGYLLELWAWNS